jgi:hypothetical protein
MAGSGRQIPAADIQQIRIRSCQKIPNQAQREKAGSEYPLPAIPSGALLTAFAVRRKTSIPKQAARLT